MDSFASETSRTRSHFGIEKLQDSNYHTWSFQCQMLLAEKKVWDIVSGALRPPEKPRAPPAEEQRAMPPQEYQQAESKYKEAKEKWLPTFEAWRERNDEALRIITFTVSDSLQAPIRYANGSARSAWLELEKVYVPKDKQRKYSLLKCLYRLEMKSGTTLSEHERIFDELVQSLAQIGKIINIDELIVLYAASLPNETFGNWVPSQMAFIDNLSISDFKGRVREEARRLNLAGFATNLGISDPNIVQANAARGGHPSTCCDHCGLRGHIYSECHKRIAEEYNAKHANRNRDQKPASGRSRGRGNGRFRGHGNSGRHGDSSNNNGTAYTAIFGGLAYCYKAAVNTSIRKVRGVWIKDSGATHHMHYDRTIFKDYTRLKHKLFVGGIKSGLRATGIGSVPIMDKSGHVYSLQKVLHVPHLKTGLMSLAQLVSAGFTSVLNDKGCTVSNGEFSIHSAIINGLC